MVKNKDNNNSSSNSLVFGQWPQTKMQGLNKLASNLVISLTWVSMQVLDIQYMLLFINFFLTKLTSWDRPHWWRWPQPREIWPEQDCRREPRWPCWGWPGTSSRGRTASGQKPVWKNTSVNFYIWKAQVGVWGFSTEVNFFGAIQISWGCRDLSTAAHCLVRARTCVSVWTVHEKVAE